MITLKYLQAENFKGLHSVDLFFPQHGSVLIEGHNEAGKSTLFEAVYVALYGKPLVGEDNTARRDEVIQHGQSRATVRLVFSIGQQELTVTRLFERGKSQQAFLMLQQPGVQPEKITRVKAVDERILKELGNLDGESLRNSCFVEQKELARIETLTIGQREQAIQKLLGLERLTKLMEFFKFKRERERELALAERHLKLAQVQAERYTLSTQEAELAERLDAVKVVSQIQRLATLEAQRAEVDEYLEACVIRAQEARACLDHCSALKGLGIRCDQTNQKMTEIHQTSRELYRREEELARLANIERVDLPKARAYLDEVCDAAETVALTEQARKRVQEAEETVREAQRHLRELEQAEAEQRRLEEEFSSSQDRVTQRQREAEAERQSGLQRLAALDTRKAGLEQAFVAVKQWEAAHEQLQILQREIGVLEAKEQELFKLRGEVKQQEDEVIHKELAIASAEQEMQQAFEAVDRATAYEALTTWIRLKGVEMTLADSALQQNRLLAAHQAAEKALPPARRKARLSFSIAIALTALTCFAFALGMFWTLGFVLFLLALCGTIMAWIWSLRTRKMLQQQSVFLAQCERDSQQLQAQRQAIIQASGDPKNRSQYEQQLQTLGLAIPSSIEVGRMMQEKLYQELAPAPSSHHLQEIAREARDNHTRLAEQLRQAKSALDEKKATLQRILQAEDLAEQLRQLKARVQEQERSVTAAEQEARASCVAHVEWPSSSVTLQTVLSTCQAELRACGEAQEQPRQISARMIQEVEADKAKVASALQQAKEITATQRALNPVERLSHAQDNVTEALALCHQHEEAMQMLLQRINLQAEAEVEPERGRAEVRVQTLEKQVHARSALQEEWQTQKAILLEALTAVSAMIEDLLLTASQLAVPELPSLPVMPPGTDALSSYGHSLVATLDKLRQACETALITLDESGARNLLDEALREKGRIEQRKESLQKDIKESQQALETILSLRQMTPLPLAYTQASLAERWPLSASVSPEEESQVQEDLESVKKRLYAAQEQEKQLIADLHHPGTPLNIEECQQKVIELTEERKMCELATKLIKETHDRIARRVLPITERNMQPLLQQLTGGRYRDVRLTPEETNGQPGEMDYRIRVWDPAARRFVGKNLFSGGTRDQCSLALRLAFALATLPQELGIAPGFIFLDEPLSAFDAQRAQALVELLTTGTIARQFNQVILISHHHAFDREAFDYHVRMEAGRIIESDLPSAEASAGEMAQLQAVHTGRS